MSATATRFAQYLTAKGRFACDALLDEMDDVIVVVQPTQRLTWDLSTFIGTLANRGIDPTHADTWFLADD